MLVLAVCVASLFASASPAVAQQVIPVVGGPSVTVPSFNPDDYRDPVTCQIALNAAINQLAYALGSLPAVTPPASNTPAALAIAAAMDALSAQRPACLAKVPDGYSAPPAPPVVAPPPLTPPPVGPTLLTPPPDAAGKTDCGKVALNGIQHRLLVRGMTCQEARDILAGVATGWQCFGSRSGSGQTHYLCRRSATPAGSTKNWAFSIPPGSERCAPVQHDGRFWDVFKKSVLCRYARNTALRGLRNDRPIVYEFTNPSQGFNGRWSCRRYGAGAGRYGLCFKKVENRFVGWLPSARRR